MRFYEQEAEQRDKDRVKTLKEKEKAGKDRPVKAGNKDYDYSSLSSSKKIYTGRGVL